MTKGELVMVVDDERTLVKALKFNLEKEGYRVEEAYNGEEALQKIFDLNPDIVVLDLMLPVWTVLMSAGRSEKARCADHYAHRPRRRYRQGAGFRAGGG